MSLVPPIDARLLEFFEVISFSPAQGERTVSRWRRGVAAAEFLRLRRDHESTFALDIVRPFAWAREPSARMENGDRRWRRRS